MPGNANSIPPLSSTREDNEDHYRTLLRTERRWRDIQPWLESKGYLLRPRYMPNWKPSWDDEETKLDAEDSQINALLVVMDATRLSDGELVLLKLVNLSENPDEVKTTEYFSAEPLKSHPRNHCVPLLDILAIPGRTSSDYSVILVFPFLRRFQDPRMKTVGEVMEFIRQILEGLQFMHSCHFAHRDAMDLNIMMDPKSMYPNMFHPIEKSLNRNFKGKAKHSTRTAQPAKYYLIDFGLSRMYDPKNGPPLDYPVLGGDKSVPEFKKHPRDQYNPFPTDIYYVGNMIQETFLDKTRGLEFMTTLVADMIQDDPSKRPDIDEVVRRFDVLLRQLRWWTLRSRLVYNDETPFVSFRRYVTHWIRTTGHILLLRSALPTPKQ
ncbi:hypothetical protein ABKN59_007473 [Abortiporus biennis]